MMLLLMMMMMGTIVNAADDDDDDDDGGGNEEGTKRFGDNEEVQNIPSQRSCNLFSSIKFEQQILNS